MTGRPPKSPPIEISDRTFTKLQRAARRQGVQIGTLAEEIIKAFLDANTGKA